jgi:acyl transferase domain-containing protein
MRVDGQMTSTPGGGGPEPVAVIGLAGRFPGATSPGELWDALAAGRELLGTSDGVPPGVPERISQDPRYVPGGPELAGIDEFDAAFFGVTPRDAELRDPQHRLFLETAHAALEHAGIDPARPGGRIGVFAGV